MSLGMGIIPHMHIIDVIKHNNNNNNNKDNIIHCSTCGRDRQIQVYVRKVRLLPH